MSTALAWTGGLGGIVVFATAVAAIVRGLFRQVSATDDNTAALRELGTRLDTLANRVSDHDRDIAWLMGNRGRRS